MMVFDLWQGVCNRLGIDAGDRLSEDSKKRKFLVAKIPHELVKIPSKLFLPRFESCTYRIFLIDKWWKLLWMGFDCNLSCSLIGLVNLGKGLDEV